MNLTSWWNSISSLERLSQYLQWGVAIGGVCLLFVSHRIETLKADRTLTPEQKKVITSALADKSKATFRIHVYMPASDSMEYGNELEKVLTRLEWISQGVILFHGDAPPTGITIMVDGRNKEAEASARNLEAALKMALLEDVRFAVDPHPQDALASSWVLIKIGRKANQ